VVAKAVCLGGGGGGGGGGDGFVVHVLNLTQNAFRSTRFLVFFRVHKRLDTHTHTHTRPHKSNTITLPIIIRSFIIILYSIVILLKQKTPCITTEGLVINY